MRLIATFWVWWVAAAMAGDDFDLSEDVAIDLGGPSSGSLISYSGGFSQRAADKIARDAAITVSAPVGTISVYCADTEFVEARVSYSFEGTDGPPMEAYGNTVKLAAYGGATSGGAKLTVGTKPASIKTAKIETVVTAPKAAKLSITGSDWVKVSGCEGTVSVSAKTGVVVTGPLRGFTVSTASGDATVAVEGEGHIKATSSITATKGNATLTMPMGQDLKVDLRGSSVTVAHGVAGNSTDTVVTGVMGAGGTALTVKASGTVTVATPSSGF